MSVCQYVIHRHCGWQVLILGGGPNRIGQGIEFDYCCCHASFALRHAQGPVHPRGFQTVIWPLTR